MKSTVKRALLLLGATTLVLLAGTASLSTFSQLEHATEARARTHDLIDRSNAFLSELKDAETGERGFLLTGSEPFLAPYVAVRGGIHVQMNDLRLLAVDSGSAQHLSTLAALVDAKLADMSHLIKLRRAGNLKGVALAIAQESGKRQMDLIRAQIEAFNHAEEAVLAQREAKFQSDMRRLFSVIVAISLLALLFALLFAYLLYRNAQQRLKEIVHLETRHLLDAQGEINRQLQQAYSTLQVSKEELAVTLDSIGDAVITTDDRARVTRLNPVAEELTGWAQPEAAGRPVEEIFNIVNQETRLPTAIPVKATLERGTIHGLANHTVLIARDGSECAIADSCAPIRNREGEVVGAVLVFRNVTEEYAAQQALHDNSALIQAVLNTVVDGIITLQASDGMIETVNPATEVMFGYQAKELAGCNISLLIPELVGDHRNGFLVEGSARSEIGASGRGRERIGRNKNGREFPLEIASSEMWLGGRRYFTSILRDLSSQKQVEEELLRAGALQKAIFNSANFSSIATDAKGVIQIFNVGAERMLGYSAAEVVNRITPADISDPQEVITRAVALSNELSTQIAPGFEALVFKASRGIEDIYELTYIRKDGSRFPAVVSVTALRDDKEAVIGYLLIGTDNTARKLVEIEQQKLDQALKQTNVELESAKIEAERANQAKSEFLATMSHEIRTPMNGVIGMIDVLQQSSLNSQQMEMANIIRDSAFALLAVINDILDFSKIEAGRLLLDNAPMSVAQVVEGVCEIMDRMTLKKGVELTLFVDPSIPDEVLGDSGRLRQILINLTNNAIKFSSGQRRAGRVSLRAMLVARGIARVELEFRVKDNGIGITPETLSRLFTAFIQADTSTTRNFGGTGLGLAISRQLTNIMNGEITVQSEPGAGSTFTVRIPFELPTVKEDASIIAAQHPELNPDLQRVSGLYCIVTGEPEGIADDISAYLEYGQARVQRAPDFTAAEQWIATRPPGRTVVIMTTRFADQWLDQLRPTTDAPLERELRFVVIGRGARCGPRRENADVLRMDGHVLTRRELLNAVAIAAGRAKEPDQDAPNLNAIPAQPQLSSKTQHRHGSRILVAEDNDINQSVILHQLALLGYVSDLAEDGSEALARWRQGNHALLLTDLHMPEMDGYELTAAIRRDEGSGVRLPIVALTANALKSEEIRCKEAGMDDYLSKPVLLDQLQAMLEKWLPPMGAQHAPAQALSPAANNGLAILDVAVLEQLMGSDPAVIEEFLRSYQYSALRSAEEIRSALARGQPQAVGAGAHKLKSSSRSVGAMALGEVCARLEQAGIAVDADMAQSLRLEFETSLAAVLAALNQRGR